MKESIRREAGDYLRLVDLLGAVYHITLIMMMLS